MSYVDYLADEALWRPNFQPHNYTNCSNEPDLVTPIFEQSSGSYLMHINTDVLELSFNISNGLVSCCYKEILREKNGNRRDNEYILLPCIEFQQDFLIPGHIEAVIVNCTEKATNKTIQEDAFYFLQYKKPATTSNSRIHRNRRKPGVLLVGIDAMSRINFRRNMPLTLDYLKENQWYELEGYNKIGDNTFPNLMALLTGKTEETTFKTCMSKENGALDDCDIIWKDFQKYGYRTAYAEDAGLISTFNYLKDGFHTQPTDHYFRPMVLATEENLKKNVEGYLPDCIGRRHAAEYIYDFAVQFGSRYLGEPIFGLFWTNTFSHDYFDAATAMDARMVRYWQTMENKGILESSIVLFFSDHGMRWGTLTSLPSGYYEERLPFFFISLPKWFRNEHPELANALQINTRRLTSPFDIHMTFKHLLEIYEPGLNLPQAQDCESCQSVLLEVPENRTCRDAAIPDHWCTCVPYKTVSTRDATVKKITNLIIAEMNQYIKNQNLSSLCTEMELNEILRAFIKNEDALETSHKTYRIFYTTKPEEPKFEATAIYDTKTKTIDIKVQDISRLTLYAKTSKCIDLKQAKKYCICKNDH